MWDSLSDNRNLTHWGRMTHTCVSKLTIIGSDNGLSPDRRQAIIWTNAGILSIGPLGTKLSDILIAIHIFSFNKMHLKMSSGKWRPCCLGLNVFNKPYAAYALQTVAGQKSVIPGSSNVPLGSEFRNTSQTPLVYIQCFSHQNWRRWLHG